MKAVLILKATGKVIKDGYYPRADNGEIIGLDPALQWLWKVETPAPEITSTQRLESVWEIQGGNYVRTWAVIDKTAEELATERDMEAQVEEEALDAAAVKALLRETAALKPDGEQHTYASLYAAWRVGEVLTAGDKRQYKGSLYKVVQGHTTQSDWTPDAVPALFALFTPEGAIADFVQPTGAHDAYALGSKVKHGGFTWESLVDANVWEPGGVGTESLWRVV
jgi:hypothetical protein